MKKPVLVGLVAVIAVLLGSTVVLYQKYQQSTTDYTAMKASEQDARSRYSEAFGAIAEIQDSLSAINVGGTQILPSNLSAEQRLSMPNKQEALDRIALLNTSIQRTKTRISQLESNLKKNGIKVKGLQKMIANLKTDLAAREATVAELTSRVDELNTRVAGLETTVKEDQDTLMARNQAIEEKRRELGTIYYIVGTKKELEDQGLIVKKGGVLGLGKSVQLTGHIDESRFTAMDTDQETVLRGAGEKVRVLSPQPAGSYLLTVAGKEFQLQITDPKEFRKIKHVVIMTG